jgi:hypothetical protein
LTSLDRKRTALSTAVTPSLAERTILVLGASRSGTTWLAKIFDSHPDVLYRHEPDEVSPPRPDLDPRSQLQAWIAARELRVASKKPFFRKSWQHRPFGRLRETLATTLNGASRLPVAGSAVEKMRVPDFASQAGQSAIRPVLKLVNWDGSAAVKQLPKVRCVFILRHPCGQVASVLDGAAKRHLVPRSSDTELLFDEAAVGAFAATHGVGQEAFRALPLAARYAWDWLFFNMPTVKALDRHRNARILLYEDLCSSPQKVAQDLFRFTDLGWNSQTDGFLASSTQHAGAGGYFGVYRSSAVAAERWRQTMTPEDQGHVRAVVGRFPIARHWPDLVG